MKNIKKITIAMCAVLALTACEKRTVIETTTHKVKVLEIDPPKHYRVTFEDTVTGKIVKERVSKRCSTYRQIKVGETYELKMQISQNEKKEQFTDYTNLKEVFCPQGD
jgi:hypothetical protein